MGEQLLEFQADRIEALLASHRIPARVCGGTVTPHAVRFHVLPSIGVKLSRIRSLAEEIALVLGADQCLVRRRRGALEMEVPRDDVQPLELMALCRQLSGHVPACTAVLGLDGDGVPLLLRLSSPEVAHVLVAGTTGSGKTALLRCIAVSLVLFNRPHQLQLAIVDPKGRGWGSLESSAHMGWPVARDRATGADLLAELADEMERRDRRRVVEPQLVLILDEMADLVQAGGQDLAAQVTRLVQRGRQAGVHVVAATQRPTSALLGGLMKANFPVRLVGRVVSAQDAVVATGMGGTGAERLRGRGAFLLVAGGEAIRVQSAFIPEEAMGQVAGWEQGAEEDENAGWSVSGMRRRLRLAKCG